MITAADFLNKHGFTPFDEAALIAEFQHEMDAGLAGEKNSSLAMLPAFIDLPVSLPRNKKVAVLDAGGTNLRAALVAFDGQGKAELVKIVKSQMPGAKTAISAPEFYQQLTLHLLEVMPPEVTHIGFCFSYPAKTTAARDARLLYWTKEIKAPQVVGQFVGAELRECLAEHGRAAEVVVLNDTVATLLAGYTVMPEAESFVGFILGTGTNAAYIEKTAAIKKSLIAQQCGRQMIINIEAGGFAKLPRSDFDHEFDATTQNPGNYQFEKSTAGVYIGGLALTVLKRAGQEGLFSAATAKIIGGLKTLENKDIDDFCARQPTELFASWNEAEKTLVRELITPLYERAAHLTAVNIAAAILRCGKNTICVNVDGSTYYKTKTVNFAEIVTRDLDKILAPRGIKYRLIHVDEAPIFGAAVAALSN